MPLIDKEIHIQIIVKVFYIFAQTYLDAFTIWMPESIFVFCVRRHLHEVCQPPIMHRNFKSANVLLDDDLSVRVSDCGLAPLISSGSVSQVCHEHYIF